MTRYDGDGGKPTDTWLAQDDSPIKVNIDSLGDYAKLMQDEAKGDFHNNLTNGVMPMLRVQAPFGGGGLKEGAYYRQNHDNAKKAVGSFISDVFNGLQALSCAAQSIHFEYLSGDDMSKASMDSVWNAFYPTSGKTLQDAQNDNDKSSDDTGNTKTTATTVDPNAQAGHGHPGQSRDPVDNSSDADSGYTNDQQTVINAGQTGQYVIPADSDHVSDAPADPAIKQ